MITHADLRRYGNKVASNNTDQDLFDEKFKAAIEEGGAFTEEDANRGNYTVISNNTHYLESIIDGENTVMTLFKKRNLQPLEAAE